jgi:hypothetical protein
MRALNSNLKVGKSYTTDFTMEDNSIGVCYFLKYFKNLNLKI